MKQRVLFLLGCLVSQQAFANDPRNIYIERRDIGESLGTIVLPMDIKGKGYISKEIWRSPKGIKCTVSLFEHSNRAGGTFECESPEGYKAQVALNCALNNSSETAVYLFFGKVNSEGEASNFYVWCE